MIKPKRNILTVCFFSISILSGYFAEAQIQKKEDALQKNKGLKIVIDPTDIDKYGFSDITNQDKLNELGLTFKYSSNILVYQDSSFCGEHIFYNCMYPIIESVDRNYLVFFSLQPYSLFYKTNHYTGIKYDLARSLNKKPNDIGQEDFNQHVYYYPTEYARKTFNMDTIISYPFSLKENQLLFDKYNRYTIFRMVKRDVGFVILNCFYTEAGFKKKDYYLAETAKVLEFKNADDQIIILAQKKKSEREEKRIRYEIITFNNDGHANINLSSQKKWNDINLKLNPSDIFDIRKDTAICIYKTLPRYSILGCFDIALESKDGDFISLIKPVQYPTEYSPTEANAYQDMYKALNISLKKFYKEITEDEFAEIVHFYPVKYACEVFNADTAFTYPLYMNENEAFKEKYNYGEVLSILKNKLGYVSFYNFYTENGYKNKERYWKEIEKIIYFE